MNKLIEADNLEIAYGDVAACKQISFYVNEGEIVTLIGSNGAGKSTTMRQLQEQCILVQEKLLSMDKILQECHLLKEIN